MPDDVPPDELSAYARCPAVRLTDGQCVVVRPPCGHRDIVKALQAAGYRDKVSTAQFGFMTAGGRFRPLDHVLPLHAVVRH